MGFSAVDRELCLVPKNYFDNALNIIGQGSDQHENEYIGQTEPHIGQAGQQVEAVTIKSADLPENNSQDGSGNDETYRNIECLFSRSQVAGTVFPVAQGEKISGVEQD